MLYFLINALILFYFLPIKSVIFSAFFSIYFYIYELVNWRKKKTLSKDDFWHEPLEKFCKVFLFFGKLFHDFEVDLSKIPDKGSALLVLYHGSTGVDMGFLFCSIYLEKQRKINVICDKLLFKLPGLYKFLDVIDATPGSREACIAKLNKGELVAVYPGGSREYLFSDTNYNLIWNKRNGFAKVAIAAKTSIIPVFTKNTRQIHGQLNLKCFRDWYENKKILPCCLVYGWFPVKLTTFIGDPIPYDETKSVDDLVESAKDGIKYLINQHQKIPLTIREAVLTRFEKQN